MRFRVASLLVVSLVACSSESTNAPSQGGGAAGTAATGGSGASGGTVSSGATGGTSGGGTGGTTGDAGTDATVSCTTQTITAKLIADTTIFPELVDGGVNCSQTIVQGTSSVLSIGAVANNSSRSLLRFQLEGLAGQVVQSTKLVLTRSVDANDCSGLCSNAGGPVSVFPLSHNWKEGAPAPANPITGANWCYGDRNDQATKWAINGADGASDRGSAAAGVTAFAKDSPQLDVALDWDVLKPWLTAGATPEIDLLVVSAGAQLFFYSKEHPKHALDAAKLTLEVCQ